MYVEVGKLAEDTQSHIRTLRKAVLLIGGCPISNGFETTMSRDSFIQMCTSYSSKEKEKEKKSAKKIGYTYSTIEKCAACGIGKKVKAGLPFIPPKGVALAELFVKHVPVIRVVSTKRKFPPRIALSPKVVLPPRVTLVRREKSELPGGGENSPNCKYAAELVLRIRECAKNGDTSVMLKLKFPDMHRSTINAIVCRRTWKTL